jgi:hypothetical protein
MLKIIRINDGAPEDSHFFSGLLEILILGMNKFKHNQGVIP